MLSSKDHDMRRVRLMRAQLFVCVCLNLYSGVSVVRRGGVCMYDAFPFSSNSEKKAVTGVNMCTCLLSVCLAWDRSGV